MESKIKMADTWSNIITMSWMHGLMDGWMDGRWTNRCSWERERCVLLIPSMCNVYGFHFSVIHYCHYLTLQTNFKCLHAFLFEQHHSVESFFPWLTGKEQHSSLKANILKKSNQQKNKLTTPSLLGLLSLSFDGFFFISWTWLSEACCLVVFADFLFHDKTETGSEAVYWKGKLYVHTVSDIIFLQDGISQKKV